MTERRIAPYRVDDTAGRKTADALPPSKELCAGQSMVDDAHRWYKNQFLPYPMLVGNTGELIAIPQAEIPDMEWHEPKGKIAQLKMEKRNQS